MLYFHLQNILYLAQEKVIEFMSCKISELNVLIKGIPSAPWNLTVSQRNGSHVLISWNPPRRSNGKILNYEICWFPPAPHIRLKLSDDSTAHLLTADFLPDKTYSFFVSKHFNLLI